MAVWFSESLLKTNGSSGSSGQPRRNRAKRGAERPQILDDVGSSVDPDFRQARNHNWFGEANGSSFWTTILSAKRYAA